MSFNNFKEICHYIGRLFRIPTLIRKHNQKNALSIYPNNVDNKYYGIEFVSKRRDTSISFSGLYIAGGVVPKYSNKIIHLLLSIRSYILDDFNPVITYDDKYIKLPNINRHYIRLHKQKPMVIKIWWKDVINSINNNQYLLDCIRNIISKIDYCNRNNMINNNNYRFSLELCLYFRVDDDIELSNVTIFIPPYSKVYKNIRSNVYA